MHSDSLDTKDVSRLAQEGAEDFRAMTSAILRLGHAASGEWILGTSKQPRGHVEPLSSELLQRRFHDALVRAGASYLEEELLAGRQWQDVDSFLAAPAEDALQVGLRNRLKLAAWRAFKGPLLEALCLAAILSRFSPVHADPVVDLFRALGPLEISDGLQRQYLWTRPKIPFTQSGLEAAPDIVFTTSSDLPTSANTLSITECKCRRSLGAGDIRAEFGKAFDLASPSYTLLCYYPQPDRIVTAAEELGLAVEVFQLHSAERTQYLSDSRDLGKDLAKALERSRSQRRFSGALEGKRRELQRKLGSGD